MKRLLLIFLALSISIGLFSQTITKEFDLDKFESISVSSGFDVSILQGNEQSIKLEYGADIEEYLKVKVVNNTLKIFIDTKSIFKRFKNRTARKAFIVVRDLKSVSIAGGGDLTIDKFTFKDFGARMSGGGDMNINSTSDNLKCSLAGGGNVLLKGMSKNLKVMISGGGKLLSQQKIGDAKISMTGGGNVEIYSDYANSIDARLSGGGDFKAKLKLNRLGLKFSGGGSARLAGNVNDLNIRMSGGGNVKAMNLEAKDCDIRLSGGGNASVYASRKLLVSASGGGDVKCYGKPSIITKRLSGGSKLRIIK